METKRNEISSEASTKLFSTVDRTASKPKNNLPLQSVDYVILAAFGVTATLIALVATFGLMHILFLVFRPEILIIGAGIIGFISMSAIIAWIAYMFGFR